MNKRETGCDRHTHSARGLTLCRRPGPHTRPAWAAGGPCLQPRAGAWWRSGTRRTAPGSSAAQAGLWTGRPRRARPPAHRERWPVRRTHDTLAGLGTKQSPDGQWRCVCHLESLGSLAAARAAVGCAGCPQNVPVEVNSRGGECTHVLGALSACALAGASGTDLKTDRCVPADVTVQCMACAAIRASGLWVPGSRCTAMAPAPPWGAAARRPGCLCT